MVFVRHRSGVAAFAAIVASLVTPLPIPAAAHTTNQVAQHGQHPAAPDFMLTGIDGQKVSLKEYRREVVLVNFWAAWCVPCRAEIPILINLERRYHSEGFQIIGVSMDDDPQPVREFSKHFPINYPLVMADERIAGRFGGIPVLPTTFLIGRDGRIADTVLGAISPARFAPKVEAALSASSRQNVRRSPPRKPPSTP